MTACVLFFACLHPPSLAAASYGGMGPPQGRDFLWRAQDLDPDAGFGGAAFPNSWNRVTAVIRHDGEPTEVELVIKVRGSSLDSTLYRRTLSLGPKAHLRITRDVFLTGLEDQVEFQLTTRRRPRRPVSVPLRFLREASHPVLAVGSLRDSLSTDAARSLKLSVAQVAPDLFPSDLVPLTSLDTIVFAEPVELSIDQQEALRRWIHLGGRLVFAAGRSTLLNQDPFWKELCPLEATTPATISLPLDKERVPFAFVRGRQRRGQPFLTAGSEAVGFRNPRGSGEVVFLAFPFDQENLEAAFPPALWSRVLSIEPVKEDPLASLRGERKVLHEDTATFVDYFLPREVTLRPLTLIAGIGALLLYVLFIGPLDYLRLRRKRALRRGWISFTLAAGAFTVLSLLWGKTTSPQDSRMVHIVLADEGVIQTFSAVRSGEGGVYELDAPGAVWPLPGFRSFDLIEREEETARLDHPSSLRLSIPPVTMQTIAGCRPEKEDLGITVRWADRGAHRLELKNSGTLTLKNCLGVTSDAVWRLGDLSPGETRDVALDRAPSMTFHAWARQLLKNPDHLEWQPGPAWERVAPDGHPHLLSFYSAIRKAWGDGAVDRQIAQRRLDLSPALLRGEHIFIGTFDEDRSNIRPAGGLGVETRGLFRRIVKEGSR